MADDVDVTALDARRLVEVVVSAVVGEVVAAAEQGEVGVDGAGVQ